MVQKAGFLLFHFGRALGSLEAKYCDIIGVSWLLGLRWDLLLLSDVPSCWDLVASPGVCCTSNCANLPFILP